VNDTPQRTGFLGFVRENWLLIFGPFALILVLLVLLAFLLGDGPGGFLYNIF